MCFSFFFDYKLLLFSGRETTKSIGPFLSTSSIVYFSSLFMLSLNVSLVLFVLSTETDDVFKTTVDDRTAERDVSRMIPPRSREGLFS